MLYKLNAKKQTDFDNLLQKALNGPTQDWYKSSCCCRTRAEHFAEAILDQKNGGLNKLNSIAPVLRGNDYFMDTHDGTTPNASSNREEERLALALFGQIIPGLGEIIDYQVPLKNKQKDMGVGKVDLLAYQEKTATLVLIELKKPDNEETLLKAVLEVFTYSKLMDQPKLKREFQAKFKGKFKMPTDPDKIDIKTAVLVGEDSRARKEDYEWGKKNGGKTYALMEKLGVIFKCYKTTASIKVL